MERILKAENSKKKTGEGEKTVSPMGDGLPISYHTFLFPFIWNDDWDGDSTRPKPYGKNLLADPDELERRLSKPHWSETTWDEDAHHIQDGSTVPYNDQIIREYNIYQYFTKPARLLVLGNIHGDYGNKNKAARKRPDKKDYVMRRFKFTPYGQQLDDCHYIIEKEYPAQGSEEQNRLIYRLKLKNVQIKVFNTGVSILSLETEYYGGEGDKTVNGQPSATTRNDINRINEFGRRIALPYHPREEDDWYVPTTATSISIEIKTKDGQGTKENAYKGTFKPKGGDELVLTHVMTPIKALLGFENETKKPTSSINSLKNPNKKGDYLISPAIDDRMFVCCFYRDEQFINDISEWVPEAKEYAYLAGCENEKYEDITNEITEIAFIEKHASKQSKAMKRTSLENSVYDRWIGRGTFHVITYHSMVCISNAGKDELDAVILPFTNLYTEMVAVVLTQKASILSLSAKASEIAGKFKPDAADPKELRAITKEISCLQGDNVKVQNQIVLSEITVREQGIEIYDMLAQKLFIEKTNLDLKDQIKNLYEIAVTNNERTEAINERAIAFFVMILAVVTIPLAFYDGMGSIFKFADPDMYIPGAWTPLWVLLWGIIIGVGVSLFYFVPFVLFPKIKNWIQGSKRRSSNK